MLFLFSSSPICAAFSATPPTSIKGLDVLTLKEVSVELGTKKGLVVVFLSAVCPCSNSHIQELKQLPKDFPEFTFVGIHSNTDEGQELTMEYFKSAALPFPVIQDDKTKLADIFKAIKTPHAFLLLPGNKIVYRGGVSNSHSFKDSDRKFLREALDDLHSGRSVKTPDGRTLGCAIKRG